MSLRNKKQSITIRLYRQFDIDLIYLYETLLQIDQERVLGLIKTIIRKGIMHEPLSKNGAAIFLSLNYPETNETPLLRYKIQIRLVLDPVDDYDIIEWLETIRNGYKNTALKAAIRTVLGEPCLFPCYKTTDLHVVKSTSSREK